MTTIYTVSAVRLPQDGADVKAFETEAGARAFVEECRAWDKNSPKNWRDFNSLSQSVRELGSVKTWADECIRQTPYGAAAARCHLKASDLVITPRLYAIDDEANLELHVFNAAAQAANVAALGEIR